jgi:hypothetical protein
VEEASFLRSSSAAFLPSAARVEKQHKKKPFDGKKNFFRRGYIDLRMHEEGYRLN